MEVGLTDMPTEPSAARIADWRDARERTGVMLVALDFDGTLAPIVAHADDAPPLEATLQAVRALAARQDTRVAVISGRALDDAAARMPVPGIWFAGNHGMEIRGPDIEHVHPGASAARAAIAACRDAIRTAIEGVPGAWVEDKGLTLSVHYRTTPETWHDRVREATRTALAGRSDLRITEGKRIVEVRPDVDWDKGRALLWLIETMRIPADAPVLYIGDDATDEDAFRALRGRGTGILVGEPRPSAAAYRIASPNAVAGLLERLAADAE